MKLVLQSTVSEGATPHARRSALSVYDYLNEEKNGGADDDDDDGDDGDHVVTRQHASAAEARVMAIAWTPSIFFNTKSSSNLSRGRRAPSGSGRGSGPGGKGAKTDSQYFFSSHGSSVKGMSPAGTSMKRMCVCVCVCGGRQ